MTVNSWGRFWAIGVGPGDPELLTLKAIHLLQRVAVIYHAGPEPRRGRAWDIVHSYLRPDQEIGVALTDPMSAVSASDWRTAYRPAVEQIANACRRGSDVAYITEGDPTLYSTAAYVWQLLRETHPEIATEIVPGVSAITAAAARVGWPLAQKDELLAVVPANYHREDLRPVFENFQTVCLLKPSAAMPEIVRALEDSELPHSLAYVEEGSTAKEWITHDRAALAGRNHYFALLIVRQDGERKRKANQEQPSARVRKVSVIGLGPGDPRLLTEEARTALHEAEIILGYEGYLRFLAPLRLEAELRPSPIGEETARAADALSQAEAGRRVALVSSGDAGIYGMASLLVECAEKTPQIQIEIVPGVTAATAAAALLGAPLGHDFACISLSDLLTPWDHIERRLAAAGHGDFVVVLYNPASQRRTWQLARARDILLRSRRPSTPVGLVEKAYRPGQRVWQTTLGDLKPDGVSMETVVIVGNPQTNVLHGRMVTPRGYRVMQPANPLPRHESDLGRHIQEESFAIIEREMGPHALPPWAHSIVRRMIHASADFEFVETLRYSPDFDEAFHAACRSQLPIVTDTEMVLSGIRSACAAWGGQTLACYLNDAETLALAEAAGLTRSAAGIRLAARRHPSPILAIGNAPTALAEAVRLIEEEAWRPAAIVGMPVGFVGVIEAKDRLLNQAQVPYLTCVGRKGGSATTAAAVNALLEWQGSNA
ncbi:MAG TPA: precorrin-3B C(17)-methyltransferase [Gemmataceae bacterium]|nr:precorrin-3B C(17)-methyltransferase [Gemmataceae bacterium]